MVCQIIMHIAQIEEEITKMGKQKDLTEEEEGNIVQRLGEGQKSIEIAKELGATELSRDSLPTGTRLGREIISRRQLSRIKREVARHLPF